MTKEQADKIAKEIVKKNSALIDGKLASINIESLINEISAALVDASKVTECAEFEETQFLFDTIESASNRIKAQSFSDLNEKNFITQKCDQILTSIEKLKLAGQKSKALKLPERKDVSGKVNYEVWANVGWNNCLDAVESLNEGK